ncbi:Cullin-domain-containing protein [Choiromyces venosus 120613-1]|uniref:Cullin-domain-containing protein n=1 Tax=Choiromyces venosus 120613-1 TaxID=1336337 RepID=A0A3N4JQ09_9PEZI|nr:Cullin-domain-containing protein [Choiromyces venosus 120613-1]
MPEKVSEQETQSLGKKRKQQTLQSSQSSQGLSQRSITDFLENSSQDSNLPSPQPGSPKRSRKNSEQPETSKNMSTQQHWRHINESDIIDLTSSPPDIRASPIPNVSVTATKYPRPAPFQPHAGAPRKLHIKNLRKPSKVDPDVYFNQTWNSLEAALTAIFESSKISTSLEELYRGTENICRADRAGELYNKLKACCDAYISDRLKHSIMTSGSWKDDVVKCVVSAWEKWNDQLGMIRSIFLYLDRSYLLTNAGPKLQPIEPTGLDIFRRHIVLAKEIETKFMNGIMTLFERDRQQLPINSSLLSSAIRMVDSLDLYTSNFEPRFLLMSREYYDRLGVLEATSNSLAEYLDECSQQLYKESLRCERYHLDPLTKRSIRLILEETLLINQLPILTDQRSIEELFQKQDHKSLTILYGLLDRIGEPSSHLRSPWEKYILEVGRSIIEDEGRENEMVQRLLELKDSLDTFVRVPFKGDDTLAYSLRESFGTFLNSRTKERSEMLNSKPAEMIAKYVDMLLKGGARGASTGTPGDEDTRLAHSLEQVLDLFRFIQGKDVFEAFYKRDLARRLLMDRSASRDAERNMLTKLKNECGSGFTQNLESMFKDIEISRDAISHFKNTRNYTENARDIDLNVLVLSQSAWPTYEEVPVIIPVKMAQYLESYKNVYCEKHSGRKLMWRHALSHCILRARFAQGVNRELVLSVLQAVVLLLFNDVGAGAYLSYRQIKEGTGLDDKQLIRTLQSLACAKYRVLQKKTKGKDILPTDNFRVNQNFSDPKFRIKINQIQLKETKEEKEETFERVAMDRQYETQAAITRIMKARKKLRHNDLIQMTIDQTKSRGTLDVPEIKKQIERLIDKDYMERLSGPEVWYQYLS